MSADIASSFSRHATHYDQFASFQRKVADQLLQFAAPELANANRILDLGCGTGYLKKHCDAHQLARTEVYWAGVDLAQGMLDQAALANYHELYHANVSDLPACIGQFDLALSNLCYQWVKALDLALLSLKDRLSSGSVFAFTTLVQGSLMELERVWACVDNERHINAFTSKEDVLTALETSGFELLEFQHQTVVDYFPSVRNCLKALQGIGSVNTTQANPAPLTKAKLKMLENHYANYRTELGLPLSYQVLRVKARC